MDIPYRYSASDKLYFTSDTHFYHEKIIGFANRPFASIQEMNEALIRNWNETVPEDGIVFHLGDFCFGGNDEWLSVIPKLNGKIILIMGNHDMRNAGQDFMSCFEHVTQQMTISVDGQTIVMNHNPFLCFGGAYRGVWQLFGHVHSGPRSLGNGKDDARLVHLFPTQYDVGVDNNEYRPVSYSQLREIMKKQLKKILINDFQKESATPALKLSSRLSKYKGAVRKITKQEVEDDPRLKHILNY